MAKAPTPGPSSSFAQVALPFRFLVSNHSLRLAGGPRPKQGDRCWDKHIHAQVTQIEHP